MIEVDAVKKKIGTRTIVDGVSLTIRTGTVFGFLGPNGAGKTTIIKMLVGLNKPTGGAVRVGGIAPSQARARERIGFMPEAPYFYDRMTGYEFVKLCGDLFARRKTPAQYRELLKTVGLAEAQDRRIGTYSKGMKQRLGFAQAIVNDPEYVFLDEPLDGLDPIGRRELKKIILELKRKGKTVFFNSHILFDTEELCDDIGILHQGSLLYAGAVKAFTNGRTLEERFVETIERAEA